MFTGRIAALLQLPVLLGCCTLVACTTSRAPAGDGIAKLSHRIRHQALSGRLDLDALARDEGATERDIFMACLGVAETTDPLPRPLSVVVTFRGTSDAAAFGSLSVMARLICVRFFFCDTWFISLPDDAPAVLRTAYETLVLARTSTESYAKEVTRLMRGDGGSFLAACLALGANPVGIDAEHLKGTGLIVTKDMIHHPEVKRAGVSITGGIACGKFFWR